MKQPDLIAKDMIEIIYMIEQSINKNLVQKGSVGKFVFKDSKERWFCLYKHNDRMKLKYIKYGVWNHFDELFEDKKKIYYSNDIFYSGHDHHVESVVRRLHNTFQQFSLLNDDRHLKDLRRDANIWSLYVAPFETESTRGLRNMVSRLAAQLPQISFESLAKLLVTQGCFVSLNYSAATTDVDVKSKSSPYYRDPNGVNDVKSRKKTILNGMVHVQRRNSIHATVTEDINMLQYVGRFDLILGKNCKGRAALTRRKMTRAISWRCFRRR
jgi:hypothetical protein